jgi:hypothetical protein
MRLVACEWRSACSPGFVGFIFLTTVGSAVNAWIHRDGYRPTDVVFYSITRGAAKISIVPTGENVYQSKSKLDFEFTDLGS